MYYSHLWEFYVLVVHISHLLAVINIFCYYSEHDGTARKSQINKWVHAYTPNLLDYIFYNKGTLHLYTTIQQQYFWQIKFAIYPSHHFYQIVFNSDWKIFFSFP